MKLPRVELPKYDLIPIWNTCNNSCTICMLAGLKKYLAFNDFDTVKELVTEIKDDGRYENLSLFGAEIRKVKDLARYARVRKQESKVSKSHLGFKWDAADNTRCNLIRYTCFPAYTVEDMLEILSDTFYIGNDRNPFEIIKGILDMASNKVRNDRFLYLDVKQENNPRSFFDINVYGANLPVERSISLFVGHVSALFDS